MSKPTLPMIDELSVSLVAECCGTCASWKRREPDTALHGRCEAVDFVSERGWGPLACLDNSDNEYVGSPLVTRAGFGCTLWSSKNAVEKRLREGA